VGKDNNEGCGSDTNTIILVEFTLLSGWK